MKYGEHIAVYKHGSIVAWHRFAFNGIGLAFHAGSQTNDDDSVVKRLSDGFREYGIEARLFVPGDPK